MARRFFIAGTAAALAAAVLALGGVFQRSAPAASASDALPTAVVAELAKGFAAGNTEAEIAGLQGELESRPAQRQGSRHARPRLRAARARDRRCDVLRKAEGILRESVALAPRDLIATAGLGSLALSRHRFRTALALGRRAQGISPTTAGVYGVIGDAELELGRYHGGLPRLQPHGSDQAERVLVLARLVCTRADRPPLRPPSARWRSPRRLPSASRKPRRGRTRSSACSISATRSRGRRSRSCDAALTLDPTYYIALDGMAQVEVGARPPAHRARVRAARRRRGPAAAAGRPARRPLPRHRRHVNASRQYALIGVIEKVLAANGVKNDLDVALFDADHGIKLRPRADARAQGLRRPSQHLRRRRARLGAGAQRPVP